MFGLFFVIGENINYVVKQFESQQGMKVIRKEEHFKEWKRKSLMFLQQYYPDNPQTESFDFYVKKGDNALSTCNELVAILKAFETIQPKAKSTDYDAILANIFENFDICARQLLRRHDKRDTLKIEDEYDVQDLLNALLCLNFSDVRPEEWTPSYAGSSKRMDFLLKDEEIVIEVKMTRESLTDKNLGEQLIIDIANYKEHPKCKTLYCFVYDKGGFIPFLPGISLPIVWNIW
jgi:hypothetical protein